MTALFVYGSLMNDEVTDSLLGHRFDKQHVKLHGYARVGLQGADYPAIFPCQDKEVSGMLLLNLSAEEVAILDAFEGDQYTRQRVQVEHVDTGMLTPCYTYVFKPEYHHLLLDCEWHNEEFRLSKMAAMIGISQAPKATMKGK